LFKAEAIYGALKGNYLSVIVTDKEVAEKVIKLNQNNTPVNSG
jgi:DNA-binding transcriptional regulator LsrR (DeoR family)